MGCGEPAKWRHAKARCLYEEGDLPGAIKVLEAAYDRNPENDAIKFELARYYSEDGQCHLGRGLCDKHLEEHPNDLKGYENRSRCLMFFGKFERALEDYKKSLSGHISRTPYELNNLSYYRGLADVQLDDAALDIQKAIDEVEFRHGWGAGPILMGYGRLSLQIRTLVAIGLVSRYVDKHEEAIRQLNQKIDYYHSRLMARTRLMRNRVTAEARTSLPFPENVEKQILNIRGRVERLKLSIAAMAATRALVYEDLGETDKADQDRSLVDELGFNFEELVADLPTDFDCLASLDTATAFLDTRGFVLGRQRWVGDEIIEAEADFDPRNPLMVSSYEIVLEDLNLAVTSAQFKLEAMESPLFNTPDLSAQRVKTMKSQAAKTTAILLHHRMEVHLRAGKKEAAAEDQLQIDALGFKDSSLF